jgi:hypothetical protein
MTNQRMGSLGNVASSSVREVWLGEASKAVRRSFAAGRPHRACDRCDLFLAENALLHAALDEARENAGAEGAVVRAPAGSVEGLTHADL